MRIDYSSRIVEKHIGPSPFRCYTTKTQTAPTTRPKTRRRTGYYVVGGVLVLASLTAAFGDDARYVYRAAQRTGRVTSALALNINEYVFAMNSTE